MADAPVSSQWIDVSRVDDVRDVVHRAVACLAQGGVVGLATETVYALVACALRPEAVARVRAMRGPLPSRPLTLLLKGPEEVTDWVPRHLGSRPADGLAALARAASRWSSRAMAQRAVRSSARRGQAAGLARRRRRPAQPVAADRPRRAAALAGPAGHLDGERPRAIDSRHAAESLRGLPGLDMVIDSGRRSINSSRPWSGSTATTGPSSARA